MKPLNLIVAVDRNFGIGKNGRLPWKIPKEIQIFTEKTLGNVVIVGSKTYEKLPTLPGRTVYCVSKQMYKTTRRAGLVFNSLESAVNHAELNSPEVQIFIAGGAELYKYTLQRYSENLVLHISYINAEYECDTYFSGDLNKFVIDAEYGYYDNDDKPLFTHRVLTYKGAVGEASYLSVLKNCLNTQERQGRNGKVLSLFGSQLSFDIRDGFPLLTTKKMFLKGIVEELLFFLRGDTNTKLLEEKNVNIWKANTSREFLDDNGFLGRPEGMMGPMYGAQFRSFLGDVDSSTGRYRGGVDQLSALIDGLRKDPGSRRHLMTSYNPMQVRFGVLYPCHSIVLQFYVSDGFLDMACYNRSSDIGLGLPFNIASSALLLILISAVVKLTPRMFYLSLGDAHVYEEHIESLKEQARRVPYKFPTLVLKEEIDSIEDIENLSYDSFQLVDYVYHPSVKLEMKA